MTMRKCWFVGLALLLCVCVESAPAAEVSTYPWLHKTIFGLLSHDRGPFSDRNESGVDPNWELQFNLPKWAAWSWIGMPEPMFGVTPNFNGDTSVFYGGLSYEFSCPTTGRTSLPRI